MPDDYAVQATLILYLLGRDRAYPRGNLTTALPGIAAHEVRAAVASLVEAGLLQVGSDGVRATTALKRLDELGLVVV